MRTRVKICGITNSEDGLWAAMCGADALGFVLYEKSPRAISVDLLRSLCDAVPVFVSKVALFVNADKAFVEEVVGRSSVDILQFHGDESLEYCEQFSVPYIKAVRVKDKQSIKYALTEYPSASAILLDTYKPGVPGGTGEIFEWDWIQGQQNSSNSTARIILAGGLTPANVVGAISQTMPYAVDVSGGVEVSKGKKDLKKVAGFIEGVNSVKR